MSPSRVCWRKAPKASAKSSATRQAPRNVREDWSLQDVEMYLYSNGFLKPKKQAQAKPKPSRSHYQLLGVEEGANASEIRKAYRRLALIYHPDKNPEDPEAAAETCCAPGRLQRAGFQPATGLGSTGCTEPHSRGFGEASKAQASTRGSDLAPADAQRRLLAFDAALLPRRTWVDAQLDSSPRSTGTPRRQEATQAWPSILQRRSLQRPMYPMWRPSRRPSPQWRDVGMPNVQQPFLADALQSPSCINRQHRSAASRPASPPQPIHRQRGLQEAQERLHEAKAYQELLELQEIQRRLQHMGLEEAQVVNEHPAAASGGSSFRSWMPERPVEKSPDMPNVRFPQAAGDGPQWGDLQLQLHEQLETLRQKLRSHSTKELKTEAIKADRSLEAQAGFARVLRFLYIN
eukprot:g17021.t1